jgi:UrcA family protein
MADGDGPEPPGDAIDMVATTEVHMIKTLPAAVVLTAALTVATSVHAESRKLVAVQTTISYRTGQLATPEGAQALLTRVEWAALRLCRSSTPSLARPPSTADVAACRSKAVSRAVAELDAPLVTAAYARTAAARLARADD